MSKRGRKKAPEKQPNPGQGLKKTPDKHPNPKRRPKKTLENHPDSEHKHNRKKRRLMHKELERLLPLVLKKIEPYAPEQQRLGRKRLDLEITVRCMLFILISGNPWNDLPKQLGKPGAHYKLFKHLKETGAFQEIYAELFKQACKRGRISTKQVLVDATTIKAMWVDDKQVGRDGHKKITGVKIQLVMTKNRYPLFFIVHPANEGDTVQFIPLISGLRGFLGEHFSRMMRKVYADMGYQSQKNRDFCGEMGVEPCIPSKKNTKYQVPKWKARVYKRTRSPIEPFFTYLKHGFKKVGLRREKLLESYIALIFLAFICIYLQKLEGYRH